MKILDELNSILSRLQGGEDISLNRLYRQDICDNVYGHGTITIGNESVDIESVWDDEGSNNLMVHVNNHQFEGDIICDSLSEENKARVVQAIIENIKENEAFRKRFSQNH